MSNTIITARITDQSVLLVNLPLVASGSESVLQIRCDFCSLWDGYGKVAVFYRNVGEVYHIALVDNVATVPNEVLADSGHFFFGVMGVADNTRTTEVVRVNVAQGAITTATTEPEDPTPDIYHQLLAAYGAAEAALAAEIAARQAADATEKAERQAEIAVERARINQFTALPNGSTTGDAELMGIRVGFDGKTYGSAGDAVRAGMNQIANMVLEDVQWVEGFYGSKYGLATNDSYCCTGYIPLKNRGAVCPIYYRVHVPGNVKIVLFNELKECIKEIALHEDSNLKICEGILTVQEIADASYIIISSVKDYSEKKVFICGVSVANSSITTEKLTDKSVTPEKISFTTHLKGTNYIDKSKLLIDKYVTTGGEIWSASGFRLTDYIKLEENTDYYYSKVWHYYYAFYDADFNLMFASTGSPYLDNPFQIPVGAVYGRFTMTTPENAELAWINTENKKPPEYGLALDGIGINTDTDTDDVKPTDYDGDDICVFTKGVCIGDSLTAGTMNYLENGGTGNYITIGKYSFPANLARLTGLEITNKGDSGDSSAEWYASHSGDDLAGHDFAIIQLGVNDAARYGGWTETSVTAFTNIINKLKTENKNIKIFVATIMPASSYSGDAINAVSQGIRDFVTALNDKDVILLDMAVYGHTNDSMAYNCGHLSAYGYWRLAKDYKAYISWYMSNNKMDFREVQFIGTDYVYSAN